MAGHFSPIKLLREYQTGWHIQSINQSIFICLAPIQKKSYLMTLFKLSRSTPCSLINLFTETQHFPHEQVLLGDLGAEPGGHLPQRSGLRVISFL